MGSLSLLIWHSRFSAGVVCPGYVFVPADSAWTSMCQGLRAKFHRPYRTFCCSPHGLPYSLLALAPGSAPSTFSDPASILAPCTPPLTLHSLSSAPIPDGVVMPKGLQLWEPAGPPPEHWDSAAPVCSLSIYAEPPLKCVPCQYVPDTTYTVPKPADGSSEPPAAASASGAGIQWDCRRLDVTVSSRSITPSSALIASQCNLKQLYCSEPQRRQIEQLHSDGNIFKAFYTTTTQKPAQDLLAWEKLDSASLKQLESRWSIAWQDRWYRKGTRNHVSRVLYQW